MRSMYCGLLGGATFWMEQWDSQAETVNRGMGNGGMEEEELDEDVDL